MDKNIRPLTGLRAVAALWVVLHHLYEKGDGLGGIYFSFGWFDPVIVHGYLGVDLFFVLSGFIISHVYRDWFTVGVKSHDCLVFLRYRVARLWPVHIVMLVATVGLYFAAVDLGRHPSNSGFYTPAVLFSNLTLTHCWLPWLGSPNVPAWSISAEWFAYLLFPAGCWLFMRRPVATAIAVVLLAPLLVSTPTNDMNSLVRVAVEFAFGMAVYALRRHWELGDLAGIILAISLVAVTYLFPGADGVQVGLLGLLIAALSSDLDLLGRLLSRPWPVYLGEISYSIYMIHWFIWSVLRHGFPSLLPPVLLMGLGLVLILLASAALYRLVEVPGRRVLRGRRMFRHWNAVIQGVGL